MALGTLDEWSSELGYDKVEGTLVRDAGDVPSHPFAPEMRSILSPREGGPRGEAVLCVDRVPTVCLVTRTVMDKSPQGRRQAIRQLCEKLWNQNLVRVVLVLDTDALEAWSVDNPSAEPQSFERGSIDAQSAWSLAGLSNGEALRGRTKWFDPSFRVDRTLLDNIKVVLEKLQEEGTEPAHARRLLARIIFVTYLEDRQIVSDQYRASRRVRPLYHLVESGNAAGLKRLFSQLRSDFNGDFLSAIEEEEWRGLTSAAFRCLYDFLSRTTLRSGQLSFWRYDFSQIPIELIASIYETFLSSKDEQSGGPAADQAKRKQGAYYTPRVLADWVVDQALEGRDVLRERIFDPACGSGMLLTAAYRRLVRAYETRGKAGGPVVADFAARSRLLLEHIFGGDIDDDACQLTAFSLYLALLSELSPPDLEALRAGGHKLPSLVNNIKRGAAGDFFSAESGRSNSGAFTIFLSNPPWRELAPADPAALHLEKWRQRQDAPLPHIPKRQIAAAFALGSANCLVPDGRVALILPVNPFVSTDPTQRSFRSHLVGRLIIKKIVNFSDMRRLVFADSAHPFVVLIAEARAPSDRFTSVEAEQFEYWTPKADISLSLGRLAVHGGDSADLPTSALLDDIAFLGVRYWGSTSDVALLQRLRRHGRIRDLVSEHGWEDGKGFHSKDEDRRRSPETWYVTPPKWMSNGRFLSANSVSTDVPFVTTENLEKFPFEMIARVPQERFFKGPRILWTDGAHPTEGVRAVYTEGRFTFQHSLAVLSAPEGEDGRLTARFLTAYLRSPLGLWLLLLLSSSVASERPKLHVQEALDWPFWSLDRHPKPTLARKIMRSIDALLSKVEEATLLAQARDWEAVQAKANTLVYRYFDLDDSDIALVEELSQYAGPALQPTSLSFKALSRPLRQHPSLELVSAYCEALETTMKRWRDVTGGDGEITVSYWTAKNVPMGAAVISLDSKERSDNRSDDDTIVRELAAALRRVSDRSPETLLTVPDLALVEKDKIFLVKPLVARFWLRRSAIEDASQLALRLQAVTRTRAAI